VAWQELAYRPANAPLRMISLWLMEDRPFAADRPMVRAALEAAAAADAGPPVHVHHLAWSRAWSRLRNAIREETLPDVLEVGSTWLPAMIELGVLVAATQPLRGPRWPPPEPEERPFVVAWSWDVRFLFFLREELQAIGMAPAQLQTLDGLREAARRVRDRGTAEPFALCGRPEPSLVHDAATWIWGAGGDFLEAGGLAPGTPGHAGLRDLLEWAAQGLISASALAADMVELFDRFAAGRYAFLLAPSLGTADRLLAVPGVGCLPVPAGQSPRTTFSGGSYLAVTRAAAHPEAAWHAVGRLLAAARPALARHHARNRRLIRMALAEAGLPTGVRPFLAQRLNRLPHRPVWAAMEERLAQALADWLARASTGQAVDVEREAGALAVDLARLSVL
jgi:hypothetical protein